MFGQEFTTDTPSLMSLPLADLGKPAHFPTVLEFIANTASPCVADALTSSFAAEVMQRTGCQRQEALARVMALVQVFS